MPRLLNRLVLLGLAVAMCGCTAEATFTLNGVQFRKKEREREAELQQLRDSRDNLEKQRAAAKSQGQDIRQLEKNIKDKDVEIADTTNAFANFRGQHGRDISDILVGLFGTPDEPNFPKLGSDVVDLDLLKDAAGPVRVDQFGNGQGLYREHCAHCHGITGDGMGPTAAFLNPYPRDYRMGLYKFKSTPGDVPPTDDDLQRILQEGIPDTAMPTFKLLSEPELDALIHYVKYLSIRGQVERSLMDQLGEFDLLNESHRLIDVAKKGSEEYDKKIGAITETVTDVVEKWRGAAEQVTPVPAPTWTDREIAIQKGKELFYNNVLKCTQCHGQAGLGDGERGNYDKWTDDWTKDIGINPKKDLDVVRDFVDHGAHQPRPIVPRNLRNGVYRGGHRPLDLYLRIKNGINGTPMPAAPAGVGDEQIWQVIEYVRSLPYESLSRPEHKRENIRERM